FAGVMREIAELGAFVERTDRVGAERAEAHRRNVEDRGGIGLGALRAADADPEIAADRRDRRQRMIDPLEIVSVNVLLRAEGSLVELALGALINDGAFRAIERRAVEI